MKRFFAIMISIVLLTAVGLRAQNSEMDPEAAKAYNDGNNLLKAGNFEGAIKKYDEALNASKDYRIYYQKAITFKKQGKLKDAEDAFSRSINANPKFDLAYNGLGGTYFTDGKYAEAVENFKKFAELTPKKINKEKAQEYIARGYTKLGESAKSDGNFTKAIEYMKSAIQSYEFDAAYIALAGLYISTAAYDDAVAQTDKVISMKSSKLKGAAYYYKGLAFKGKEDKTKAKENFEIAKKDPQYKKNCEYELNLLK